jgi:hypothetical protein
MVRFVLVQNIYTAIDTDQSNDLRKIKVSKIYAESALKIKAVRSIDSY